MRKIAWLAGVMCLALSGSAAAYLGGGHYYTLLALGEQSADTAKDPYWHLQMFCAELPDMSMEFDALTQRARVMWDLDLSEMGSWGWAGECHSHTSKHMVASQYYLHGLTGGDAAKLRAAARSLLRKLDPAKGANADEKATLACAKGLATHLYGDSFAHVEQTDKQPGRMYRTGMGHAREGSTPDYIASTLHNEEDRWQHWVEDASQRLFGGTGPSETFWEKLSKQPITANSDAEVEATWVGRLLNLVGPTSAPQGVILKIDTDQVKRNFLDMVQDDCQSQLNKALAAPGIGLPDQTKVNCAAVWQTYIKAARRVFKEKGIDIPTTRETALECDDAGDELKWGSE